jgi:hypothetical protein
MDPPASEPDPIFPKRRTLTAIDPARAVSSQSSRLTYLPLFIVAVFYGVFIGLQLTRNTDSHIVFVVQFLMAACCAVWVTRDARRRRRFPFFDFGTLILFTCGIALPIYLIWTRGWRGVVLLALLGATAVGSAFANAIVAGLVRAFR